MVGPDSSIISGPRYADLRIYAIYNNHSDSYLENSYVISLNLLIVSHSFLIRKNTLILNILNGLDKLRVINQNNELGRVKEYFHQSHSK